MKRRANQIIVLLLVLVIPALSFGQTTDPVPGPPPGGGEGVPFDDNMNLVFLMLGVAFAVLVTLKQLRRKKVASN